MYCSASFFALLIFLCSVSDVKAEPRNCSTASRSCFDVRGNPDPPCLVFRLWLSCLGDTGDVCQLDERRTTFDQLTQLAFESCQVLTPLGVRAQQCSDLGTCVSTTKTAAQFSLTDINVDRQKQQEIIDRSVISTGFWCRYMEENMGCYVSNADACSFNENDVTAVQGEIDKVKAACSTSGSERVSVTLALMMYAAVVVLYGTSH